MPLRVNIPPATRACLISLLSLSLLYNIARWRQMDSTPGKPAVTPIVPYLTLVPSRFIFYPWTLVTATFVEQNIFTVLLNGATLFYGGKYLERAWSSREFTKFIVTIALIPNAVIVPLYLIGGALRGGSSGRYVPPLRSLLTCWLPLLTHPSVWYRSVAASPFKPPSSLRLNSLFRNTPWLSLKAW